MPDPKCLGPTGLTAEQGLHLLGAAHARHATGLIYCIESGVVRTESPKLARIPKACQNSPIMQDALPLQGGNLVVGARQFNFSQQASYFNYSLITPNLADLPAYRAALQQLTQVVQGLATGFPPWQAATPCNSPIPALQGCVRVQTPSACPLKRWQHTMCISAHRGAMGHPEHQDSRAFGCASRLPPAWRSEPLTHRG